MSNALSPVPHSSGASNLTTSSRKSTTTRRSQSTTVPAAKVINTDHISMADITLADGFESKSETVQQAMIQRAKELKAKQDFKVAKAKAKEKAAAKLKLAKQAAEGAMGDEMKNWAKDSAGGPRKLRTLLCELPKVLWEGTKWKPVDMADVMEPKRVRLIYLKSMRIVHPDKLKKDATADQKVRAEHIFDALNNAWKLFQEHEM
jgi:hypothetical protein